MQKLTRRQSRRKTSRQNRIRTLKLEQLEDRRLLVSGSSSVTSPGSYGGGHVFTITEPAALSGVINIPAGSTSYFLPFKANITRGDADFPVGVHAQVSLEPVGALSPGSFLPLPATNIKKIEFSGSIEVPAGSKVITFKAKRAIGTPSEADTGAQITTVVNRIPRAVNSAFSTNEDIDLNGQVSGSDDDRDTLTFSILTNPRNGQLLGGMASNGTFIYRPNPDFNGTDSFTFKANDGNAEAVGTVSLTINRINDAPRFAESVSLRVNQGTSSNIDGALGAIDPEGDAIVSSSIVISKAPTAGTAVLQTIGGRPTIVYSPNQTFQGTDSFEYTIADAFGARSAPRMVTIGVVDRPTITALVDDVQPVIGSLSFPAFTNDLQPVFSGTAEPGASVRLVPQSGINATTVTADATGKWQITLTSPLPNATRLYSIVAEATSAGTPPSTSAAVSFSIDVNAPTVGNSLKSELRSTALSEDVVYRFVEGTIADPVTGIGLEDFSLVVNGSTTNLLTASNATLTPTTSGTPVDSVALRIQPNVTSPTGTYTLSLKGNTSGIADRAGNLLTTGVSTSIAVDKTAPKIKAIALNTESVSGSTLPVPVIAGTSASGALVSYAVTVTDQQFTGFTNTVFAQLVSVSGTKTNLVSPRLQIQIPSGNKDKLNFDAVTTNLVGQLPLGQSELKVLLTDASGNELRTGSNAGSPSQFVFVSAPSSDSLSAPSTPVDTTMYFLGARLTTAANKDSTTIQVNQKVRIGATIRLLDEKTSTAAEVVEVTNVSGTGPFTLTLKTGLSKDYPVSTTKISWLRPWTMSFDKTTQTTWFTNEDGQYLGQFDPATGDIKLFDVVLPGSISGAASYDPHGVFFDFNTHLTPRVWFVYRNENTDGDTPKVPNSAVEKGRIGYLDVVTKKLFTFDLSSIGVIQPTSTTTPTSTPISGTHAVFIDARGHAWISSEESNAVIEIDLATLPNGSRTNSLSSLSGSVIVHNLPEELADIGEQEFEFQVHGIQVVVDQRTNEPYVWLTDGNNDSTGRIVLLRPGSHATGPLSKSRSQDEWFEWSVDEALRSESRLTDGTDSATGLPILIAKAHPLFLALDDNETPGIPEDDRIISPDGGALNRAGSAGVIRSLDASNLVSQLVKFNQTSSFPPASVPATSAIATTIIPKIPGASSDMKQASPSQGSVDRAGNIYFNDQLGSIGRLNFDDKALKRSTIQAPIRSFTTNFQVNPITFAPTVVATLSFVAERLSASAATADDRSQVPGVDQYELAQKVLRGSGGGNGGGGSGAGGFRFALTAENTAHTSISQSDHIAVTAFAESNRRQLAVLPSPFTLSATARIGGRVALQVLRDGSVVLTGRGDGELLDAQVNLTKELFKAGKIATFDAAAVIGDMAALTNPDGVIEALGRQADGGLIRYKFNPPTKAWKTSDLKNVANWTANQKLTIPGGQILAEDPAPAPGIGFTATTSSGHLIVIRSGGNSAIDLSAAPGSPAVFAGVGAVVAGTRLRFYGSNQTGKVVEYSTNLSFTDVQTKTLVVPNTPTVRPSGDSDRDIRILRNIRPLVDGATIHLFATDGVSRLVHYELDFNGNVKLAENVTRLVQSTNQVYGYFGFEKEYGGRVYTYVSAVKDADGNLRVYGTNGGELIEFTRSTAGVWRAGNLTNNIRSTNAIADPDPFRIPANSVFGAPNVYVNSLGERHILQINAEGEIVEYYTVVGDTTKQIRTQNVNLRLGSSSSILNLRYRVQAPLISATNSVSVGSKAASVSGEASPAVAAQTSAFAVNRFDVNADGMASPLDILTIINYMSSQVRSAVPEGEQSNLSLDVSGDGVVSALDVLQIINYLNRQSRVAEGEDSAAKDAQPNTSVSKASELSDSELAFAELSDSDSFFDSSKKRSQPSRKS